VAIEAGLMLRLAFGRPWRQTEGLLGSIMDLLGLNLPVPDHTTFSCRSVDLGVATALKKVSGPVQVVIDSTGLKCSGPPIDCTRSMAASRAGAGASSIWRSIPTAASPHPQTTRSDCPASRASDACADSVRRSRAPLRAGGAPRYTLTNSSRAASAAEYGGGEWH
jgi:hypothetical protein